LIGTADRAAIFGRTGSGKTTLVRDRLLRGVRRYAVIDPKHEFVIPGAAVRYKYDRRRQHVIYRYAHPGDPGEMQWYNDLILRIFNEGNRLIVVDETHFVTKSNPTSPGIARAMRMGRSKGVGVWLLTQSPTRVPHEMLSQTEHLFIFHLQHAGDQERVVQLVGKHIIPLMAKLTQPGHKHDFIYHQVSEHRTVYIRQPYTEKGGPVQREPIPIRRTA
jgi:hypothetical protein